MSKTGQYEFDVRFYLIALSFAIVITATPYIIKRRVDVAAGKDVQRLITKANLDSPAEYQKQARNYCAPIAYRHKLSSSERKKVEEVFAKAFEERSKIWIDGRKTAETAEQTRAKQHSAWSNRQREFEALLRSFGK